MSNARSGNWWRPPREEIVNETDETMRPMERYRRRVEEHPESAAAHFNLGLAHTKRGFPGRAEPCYRKALDLDPDLIEAWVNLGGVLLLKRDFKGSIAANEEALKRDDALALAHYNIGQALLYLGDAEGVVRSYRRLVDLHPQHAGAHYFLAVGLLATDHPAEARKELSRAQALGHRPAPEFLRALGKAEDEPAGPKDSNIVTLIGTDTRETEKED
jgi:tetratricopeptide (TPR) repeat protein